MNEETIQDQEAEPKPVCPNCRKKMPRKSKFCPDCGQRRFDGHFRMAELYERFVRQAFHLDNKILKMTWHLLLPAKVSIAFFNGQIKRYPNPVQFFFVIMFFFVFLYSHVDKRQDQGPVKVQTNATEINSRGDTSVNIQLSGNEFYQALEQYARGVEMRRRFDSLPERLRTPEAKVAVDTLIVLANLEYYALHVLQNQTVGDSAVSDATSGFDSIPLGLLTQQVRVSTVDLMRLEPEVLADKYHIDNWLSRILLKQGVKAMKDPEGLRRAYLGSFTWTVLVLIATMSLVLLWFFRKQRPFYAEQFIFLLHQHSGAFLMLAIGLAIQLVYPLPDAVWIIILLGIWVFLLFAMRRFYLQSWGWTIFKWVAYSGIYAVSFALVFMLGLMAVLLVF